MDDFFSDEFFMKEALKEARLAFDNDEVPIGAVVVANNQVIAKSHNSVETLHDVTAHAEILAITSASNYLGSKYLIDCSLYVTIEPCVMCAGAISWARLGRLVIGSYDEKAGFSRFSSDILHPKTEFVSGILENDCSELMRNFFRKKRS